jgi:transcriptional regulator with XRE-family HTH domain
MQQQNQSNSSFSEQTDRLAEALNLSLRDLADHAGISQAMFFGYRSGAYPVSDKAWRKLKKSEQEFLAKKSELLLDNLNRTIPELERKAAQSPPGSTLADLMRIESELAKLTRSVVEMRQRIENEQS